MDASEHPTSICPTVSPLRQRMIMSSMIRRFGEHTKRDDVRQVAAFAAFLGRAPDRAEPDDLRRYQLHLAGLGASYARMNLACTALRFFFHITLGRAGFGDRMARIPTPERLPVVLATSSVPSTTGLGMPLFETSVAALVCDRPLTGRRSGPVR